MDREKVLNLAKLARIEVSDKEAESLSHEFESILNYVSDVKKVSAFSFQLSADSFPVRNVMREDVNPHESGIHTEKLLNLAPKRQENFLKVKKIL